MKIYFALFYDYRILVIWLKDLELLTFNYSKGVLPLVLSQNNMLTLCREKALFWNTDETQS